MTQRNPSLTITARGPAAAGSLPLAEVARLCGEFQATVATVERIALGLHGATTVAGRRPKDVVEAVRLLFTGFREGSAVREVRREVRHDETTIVGLLQMGDFAPSALRCRIDTIETSVLCTFDESLSGDVLACLNSMVVASGTGEFLPGGILRSLDLTEVRRVERSPSATLDELAQQQGVTAWTDEPTDFGLTDELEDDDFAAFLDGALSSRGDR